HVDDPAGALPLHRAGGGPRAGDVPAEVDGQHPLPLTLLALEQRAAPADAGDVDEHVEPAEAIQRGADDALPARKRSDPVVAGAGGAAAGLDLGHDLVRGSPVGAGPVEAHAGVVDDDPCAYF